MRCFEDVNHEIVIVNATLTVIHKEEDLATAELARPIRKTRIILKLARLSETVHYTIARAAQHILVALDPQRPR